MKLRLVSAEDVSSFKSSLDPVNPSTLESAREILQDVQTRGLKGLQDQALRLGDIEKPDQQILLTREDLSNAFKSIPTEQQELLLRVAGRIRTFAQHQLDSLKTFRAPVPGGYASQRVDPVARAGCYAPGGRFPLPSSVLMTAITAVVAGVKEVLVASPRPAEITKAAAFVSGASGLIAVGGAQAVAAMAYGIPEIGISPVDVIVGPGNKWVTAAKQLVSGTVAIDMLAGPSELLVIADQSADPEIVAADLIAQAEHDVVALPVLVTTFPKLVKQVEEQLSIQLENLPTKETATKSLSNGFAVVVENMEEAVRVSNEIAPEHLELMVENEDHWMNKLDHYGALFMGKFSAEVLGDYGIGPNHTLPTGATCKSKGGLSVFNFLRIRTVLQISDESDIRSSDAQQVVQDSIDLALLEGLHGHARSAQKRLFSLASRNTPTSTNSSLPMTEDALESFFRPDLRFMSDYSPVIPVELLARKYGHDASSIAKLDANENLYATIPEVVSALSSAVKNIPYYPDPTSQTLRSKIANHYDVSVESIVVGSGSDELLELLFKVFLPSTVLVSSPAFGMYAFLSQQYNAKLFQVERSSSNSYELNEGEVLQAIRQHSIKMVLLDSPNNPTGKSVSNEFVESLCRENCIVVVDEAYADFAENSALDVFRLQKFPNLIVLRTFSKWAGLAGLRIGYGFFHSTVARNLMKIKQPYNVNVMAEAAAIACLENKHKMEASIKNIVRERNRLLSQLSMFEGVVPFPSQANFILCKVSPSSVLEIQERLRQQGVFVRCYDNHVVGNCVRISCARSTDSDKVIMAFSKLFPVSQLAPKEFFMGLVYICPNSPQYEAPKAVLFDMDGVLADVSKSYRECIIKTAAFFGVKVSSDDIQNAKNQGNANNDWILTQKLISLNSAGVTQVKIDKVTEKFQEYYLELRHKERLLCSKELLRQLYQSGFKLGIVTGRPREEAEFFLKLHEIQTFFPVLVCMNETKLPKPDAEPVLECLRQLGVDIHDPDETPKAYFIGDTPDDMISAVGCKSGRVVPFGFNAPEPSLFSAGAARVLDSLDDLKYYLRLGDVSLPNARVGEACRVTKETAIRATVNLDGSGQQNISTGVGFLDHMISAFSKHGRFDIDINCSGDLHIDDHHSVEDCALVLGEAFGRALGSKSGIMRYGSAYAPLDEALVRVVVDLSGRPFSDVNLEFTRDSIGNLSCEMIPHFFSSFATSLNATLHVDLIKGKNSHHIAESAFKALALSMRLACSKSGFQDIASTKGTL